MIICELRILKFSKFLPSTGWMRWETGGVSGWCFASEANISGFASWS
jgi:hypothetical protein